MYWDLIDDGQVSLALSLVLAASLGKLAGTALRERISEKTFCRTTLDVTPLTGALGVAIAVWALI